MPANDAQVIDAGKTPPSAQSPKCPECDAHLVAPVQSLYRKAPPNELLCMFCGHDWTEDSMAKVCQAWYGLGAADQEEYARRQPPPTVGGCDHAWLDVTQFGDDHPKEKCFKCGNEREREAVKDD